MFVSSICIWIPFAYLLFSFAWGLKEVFRLFTTDRAEIPFLTLTTSEQNFYAMWYASMALVVTFGFVARPMFLLRLSSSAVARRRRSGIATDLQNLSNLFLYLFSKVAVLYWAVGLMLGANYYFDLYSSSPLDDIDRPGIVWESMAFGESGIRASWIEVDGRHIRNDRLNVICILEVSGHQIFVA